MNKKLIGRVGVDSGQLLVCDPAYIEPEWKVEEFKDVRSYRHILSEKVFVFLKDFMRYDDIILDGKSMNDLLREGAAEEVFELINNSFSYAGCCSVSHSENQGGSLNYRLGHEGVGVVFSSGYGDGFYPIYAFYDKNGKIVKIEINLDE